jgi:hypothetical protein
VKATESFWEGWLAKSWWYCSMGSNLIYQTRHNQPTQPTTLILLHTRRCGETRWSRENDTLRIAETNRGELQEGRKRKETAPLVYLHAHTALT